MLKEIWLPKLADILPRNILADKQMHAAAEALDLELKALSYDAWQVLHIPRLDELDHDVLDTLAWQFHCDFYEPSTMSLEVKRNLIRESILWHRIKGTPQSVEDFLGYFGIKATVKENWEYGGEPYFFRLTVSDVAYLGDDGETFMRLVYAAKNERSWLDLFIFDLTREPPDIELFVGFPTASVVQDIIDGAAIDKQKINLHIANQTVDTSKTTIDIDSTDYSHLQNQLAVINRLEIGGYTEIAADIPDDSAEWWWLLWIYQKWRNNPVIKPHNPDYDDPDDGEFDPDDPQWEEPFPYGRDFLRLYWQFPDNRVRFMTLKNPRKNVTGAEINAVGNYAVQNKALLNSNGYTPTKINRALYITQRKINLLGGSHAPGKIDNGRMSPYDSPKSFSNDQPRL